VIGTQQFVPDKILKSGSNIKKVRMDKAWAFDTFVILQKEWALRKPMNMTKSVAGIKSDAVDDA
jgi:hypothetical protein